MQEIRKILASSSDAPNMNPPMDSHTHNPKDDKPKVVVQTNLTPVRCGTCNALLAKGSLGSLLAIVCGRCKTYNLVEIQKPFTETQKRV